MHCRGQSKGFLARFFVRGSLYVSYEPITRANNFDLSHIWTCVTVFVTVLSYDSATGLGRAGRGALCKCPSKGFLAQFFVRGSLYVPSYEPINRANTFCFNYTRTCVTVFVTILSFKLAMQGTRSWLLWSSLLLLKCSYYF